MNTYPEDIFSQIYEENSKMMLKLAYGYVYNTDQAWDIVQNVFLKMLKTSTNISPDQIKYWLIRVTINESINYVKSSSYKKVELNNDYIELVQDSSESSDDCTEQYQVLEQIKNLNELDQKIINLFYFNKMSLKDISKILNKNEEMIKKRIQRARSKLKELVEQSYEEIK